MTVNQAATRLETSKTTVYALVAAGKLRCFRVGVGRGCIRIAEEHLAEYLKRAEPWPTEPKAPPPPRLPRLKHLRLS
jgi:excisionase family DNA binding protein